MLSYMSTESLLNSFPMFGHPGISALEYAGQLEEQRNLSTSFTEVSLKRKSATSTPDENLAPAITADAEVEGAEESPPVPSVPLVDELGCQQRRRGTFINHTPRNYEVRSSKPVEVYHPSRTDSENYSRPLSRHGSMASNSPTVTTQMCQCEVPKVSTAEYQTTIQQFLAYESELARGIPVSTPDVYVPSSHPHRRSVSAPLGKLVTQQPPSINVTDSNQRDESFRSASSSSYVVQEKKRQRRQTPWKIPISESNTPRHAPLEPWVAEHRRKRTSETIGDVPFDMEREVSGEIGPFGVIQKYFDSQGGGPVTSPMTAEQALCSNPPDLPSCAPSELNRQRTLDEPIAIYSLDMPEQPPPVPDRSPKRLTNPSFPLHVASIMSTDSDFQYATEGQYSPYDKKDDMIYVAKKRNSKRPAALQAARAGSSNLGKMAPPILGHHALTASSDLGLNDLSYYLKHTGPSSEPQSMAKQRKRNGMKLFKPKPRKSLAARVGSVESSPQRPRRQPAIPACAKEMTTSAGARHLKIIIPAETPRASQAMAVPVIKAKPPRRSRHVSITFTEEMLNPLGSPEVERILSNFDTRERSVSAPLPKSPRSPKKSPKAPRCVPVTDHPLSSSRNEQTRARKLRDLQRIKRKPVPMAALPEQQQQLADVGALLTPAHTPEPVVEYPSAITHDDSGVDEGSPANKMDQLQDRMMALQRQNMQLTEALAKIVGLELDDGDLKGEEVLKAVQKISHSRVASAE